MILRTILGHPMIRPLKHAAKDAWWRYKGRTIVNPPVPIGTRSVLFVCLGNICRSPFAEAVAARRMQAVGDAFRVGSAGIKTNQAGEPPLDARRAAAMFGVALERRRPVALTRNLVDSHDLIVVMEPEQREHLRAAYPGIDDRVYLLSLFDEDSSGLERFVIVDPFGLTAAAYDHCYRRIDRAVLALLSAMGARLAGAELSSARRHAC